MKITHSELAATAAWSNQYPAPLALDVVLAGRSNVGKSSLINCLLNRKNLARTSSGPGKTRTVNFYLVNKSWYFVDLPGYGYAKVSHAERENFRKMVDAYLACERRRLVWQIVDLRHKPSPLDLQMLAYLRATGLPYLLVATKADKLRKNEVAKQRVILQREMALAEDELILFSAATGLNRELLLQKIDRAISNR